MLAPFKVYAKENRYKIKYKLEHREKVYRDLTLELTIDFLKVGDEADIVRFFGELIKGIRLKKKR